MSKFYTLLLLLLGQSLIGTAQAPSDSEISLRGEWRFQIDRKDEGVRGKWFEQTLNDKIQLPGSLTSNGKGDDVTIDTPWMGSLMDSSWFKLPAYSKYRDPGNLKVPFWLQPVKYYKGAAWFQKTVTIPSSWKGRYLELFIERSHWETTVWVDNARVGVANSLGTPHVFNLSQHLTPGEHKITICVDNRIKDFNVGQNSHSISDHTQGNWNGMTGRLSINSKPSIHIAQVKLYPDIQKKQVIARVVIKNTSGKAAKMVFNLLATSPNPKAEKLQTVSKEILASENETEVEVVYPMGNSPLLWDEFHPELYTMNANLTRASVTIDARTSNFGMKEFSTKGTQFTINGNPTILRGTLECAIFPKTGYPPTEVKAWTRIFQICRSYGLNHVRFHSWTPPEAAFVAADELGFYLQIECSSWANFGSSIGDGHGIDQYIMDQSNRVVNAYGNHPSFCLMAYGNEPGGPNHVKYLTEFVKYWKAKDSRFLYTTGAGWPVVTENNYNSTPEPRIQHWGDGIKSIINGQPPRSDYDWSQIIGQWQHPTVSHEIGQWCVYPDFKEMSQYDGVLKAKNFEIFEETLKTNGLSMLADSFLLASGKLQTLCYKADIEAALRTPGFGGFQLLDLHDFPGQGTALVGVLNPFWESKGYVTPEQYSAFCNATVPLVRMKKMIYLNSESLNIPVEVSHFGSAPLENVTPHWSVSSASGKVLFEGDLPQTTVPLGNAIKLGDIKHPLSDVVEPSQLTLRVKVSDHVNSWSLFVYPATTTTATDQVLVTQQLDTKAMERLSKGGTVLLSLKQGALPDEMGGNVAVGFSSIFWNTAWTNGQAPFTLGILCDPNHPAFKFFPTEYHSNWQWWDAMSHANAIRLDKLSPGIKPVLRVIDDWVTANSLGLLVECRVGKGKLMVSGIDLLTQAEQRPEARQLLYSLRKYMTTAAFNPKTSLTIDDIKKLSP